jgi:hypothetical protein
MSKEKERIRSDDVLRQHFLFKKELTTQDDVKDTRLNVKVFMKKSPMS